MSSASGVENTAFFMKSGPKITKPGRSPRMGWRCMNDVTRSTSIARKKVSPCRSNSIRAIFSHIQSQLVHDGRHSAATTHLCSASAFSKKYCRSFADSRHATPRRPRAVRRRAQRRRVLR